MTENNYQPGELVIFLSGKWKGFSGVVSWPITPEDAGFVLFCSEGRIAGIRASANDVEPPRGEIHGYTQLAYQLIKLASYVIEKCILPAV